MEANASFQGTAKSYVFCRPINSKFGRYRGFMSEFEFKMEEAMRNGYIAWNAIDSRTGDRFQVNASAPYKAGTFPEITEHLRSQGVDFLVAYLDSHKDSLTGTTWSYVRGGNKVTVHDIPRTIFRLTAN